MTAEREEVGFAILDLIMDAYPGIRLGQPEHCAEASYQIAMCLGGVAALCALELGGDRATQLIDATRENALKNMRSIVAEGVKIEGKQ